MVGEHGAGVVSSRRNPVRARPAHRRDAEPVTPQPASPQTVQELAAAIMGVILRYAETRGATAHREAALALAIADRQNFRLGRT
jgi:hypothetical protein